MLRAQQAVRSAHCARANPRRPSVVGPTSRRRGSISPDSSATRGTHLRTSTANSDALYQRQYNLAAERGVAAKRIEAVQGVLASLAELASP